MKSALCAIIGGETLSPPKPPPHAARNSSALIRGLSQRCAFKLVTQAGPFVLPFAAYLFRYGSRVPRDSGDPPQTALQHVPL